MYVADADELHAATRPPRAMAWILLLASAATVLVIGLAATALILGRLMPRPRSLPRLYWIALLAGCGATIASLGLRSLRWVFLLRRADVRIPIRDAYIGYLAGLSLLFVPFLIGEIAIRVVVLRARTRAGRYRHGGQLVGTAARPIQLGALSVSRYEVKSSAAPAATPR